MGDVAKSPLGGDGQTRAAGLMLHPRLRVFISYSHEDRVLVEQIADLLEANGVHAMWDKDFTSGAGFHLQIRRYIAHAHVFVPIITKASNSRNWVHQEIGYAIARHVPVIPIAVGQLPGEMIQEIHAVSLEPGDLGVLRTKLSRAAIETLVDHHAGPEEALYICAELTEDRARMLATYATDVLDLGEAGLVRQKGGLSSFHIPTTHIDHLDWAERYGKQARSRDHCRLQREERLALGRHAEQKGCRLIVNPTLTYREYGPQAARARLGKLLEFLTGMPDDLCQVAIWRSMPHTQSLTIVGSWFAAESVSASVGEGYRQTIFTRHGPTVIKKAREFDSEFEELLPEDVAPEDSRRWAIGEIEARLSELLQKPSKS